MRFWFVVALGIATGSVFFCLCAKPMPGGGIGDGGPATNATLYGPTGLALDKFNLYILESQGKRATQTRLRPAQC